MRLISTLFKNRKFNTLLNNLRKTADAIFTLLVCRIFMYLYLIIFAANFACKLDLLYEE